MPTRFRPYQPKQKLLLPPDIRDWLPEDHLAHHVSDLVDGLDLTAFYAPYEGDGRRNRPYEPRMMVKLLIRVCDGDGSRHGIAKKVEEDLAFRMLRRGIPAHRKICDFVVGMEDFRKLFVEVPAGAGDGVGEFREAVDRRDEGEKREQAKAMTYARMQEAERRLENRDSGVVATFFGRDGRCGG